MNRPFVLESQIRLSYRYAVGRWYGAFLSGLAEGRLVGSRCSACKAVAVPARAACPTCSGASAELVLTGPRAVVVSAAADAREGGRRWLLVRPEGATTTLLTSGEGEIGAIVVPDFDSAAGASIHALKGFRPA